MADCLRRSLRGDAGGGKPVGLQQGPSNRPAVSGVHRSVRGCDGAAVFAGLLRCFANRRGGAWGRSAGGTDNGSGNVNGRRAAACFACRRGGRRCERADCGFRLPGACAAHACRLVGHRQRRQGGCMACCRRNGTNSTRRGFGGTVFFAAGRAAFARPCPSGRRAFRRFRREKGVAGKSRRRLCGFRPAQRAGRGCDHLENRCLFAVYVYWLQLDPGDCPGSRHCGRGRRLCGRPARRKPRARLCARFSGCPDGGKPEPYCE